MEKQGYASIHWSYELAQVPDNPDASVFDDDDHRPFLLLGEEQNVDLPAVSAGKYWQWMDESGWKNYSLGDCQEISDALTNNSKATMRVGQSV